MKWSNYIGHGALLVSVLFTLAILMTLRFIRERKARRAPLAGKKLGNLPGQQLLDRIRKHDEELTFAYNVMITALPFLFMIWATMHVDWKNVRFGIEEVIFTIGWLLIFSYGIWSFIRHDKLRQQARDGLLAERVTGMQLNRLVANGCSVLHDVPSDVGNIDHIVIAPSAVFVVETKSFRKPNGDGENHKVLFDGKALKFPDFVNTDALTQAERNADWVKRYLRQCIDQEFPIVAALSLPGWFIERTQAGKEANIKVFTPMGRGAEFMTWGNERINLESRGAIARALAEKYPLNDA